MANVTQRNRRSTRKKVSKLSPVVNNIVIGIIIFLTISLLLIIMNSTGIVGDAFRKIYYTVFGMLAPVIILITIITLVLFVLRKLSVQVRKNMIFVYMLFINACVVIDLNVNSGTTFITRKTGALILADKLKGSGVVGAFLDSVLLKLIGSVGIYILTVLICFFAIINFTGVEYKTALKKIWEILSTLIGWLKSFFAKIVEILNNLLISKDKKRTDTIETNSTLNSYYSDDNQANNHNIKNNELNSVKTSKASEIPINNYYRDINSETSENESSQLILSDIDSMESNTESYRFPPTELLREPEISINEDNKDNIIYKAGRIESTLRSFGIESKVVQINRGPTVTCYELEPAPGVKVSKIVNLADDLSLSLATSDIRIEAPIPGKSVVGIEVANDVKDDVLFKEILDSEEYVNMESKLPLGLGKSISGLPIVSSIDKMPHLLIAGATGSGKSVCINTIIMSIIYKAKPDEVKLILIDPKVVELSVYNGIPHLAIPVVTNPKKASSALNWAVAEMERRYQTFSENLVRDIKSYNEKSKEVELEKLPYIVIVIDELSDLMMVAAGDVEDAICRLAQMARACGIHLIVATQRPTVDVITGTIKANIPSRISFAVSSQIDSRTILDNSGAEKLLGKGDMLFFPSNMSKPLRVQGAFISDREVENVVSYLKSQHKAQYNKEIIEDIEKKQSDSENIVSTDELFEDAVRTVLDEGSASISLLQRKMKIGYARAGRLIDEMEQMEIVGPNEGSKPRKILVSREYLRDEV